jgi:peptidoglycan pentaglycine glycine transferase (the first glycine)
MKLRIIASSQQWDLWLKNNSRHHSFTQAWAWGDILLAEGKQVERLAVVEGENILAQAQIVYSQLPFGWQYVFCPKGPVFDESRIKNYEVRMYETIINYLKEKNVIFLRVEPEIRLQTTVPEPLCDSVRGFASDFRLQKTIDINPSATLILDLNKTEEDFLAGMHQKTRYNIHLAEKKDLKISKEKNLEIFWNLANQTGSRDKFGLHNKKHYEKVLQSPMARQFTAYENEKPIACTVFVVFGDTFTYLYGASDYEYRNLMAPYLLQWEGIKMGKNSGCSFYDFFGVAPRRTSDSGLQTLDDNYDYDLKHQYAGVTRFKLGFGGIPFQAPGTFDVVIDKNKYLVYNFLRKLRRLF